MPLYGCFEFLTWPDFAGFSFSCSASTFAWLFRRRAGQEIGAHAPAGNAVEVENRDGRPSGNRTWKLPILGTASCRMMRTRFTRRLP
jgi:hypothetical protein